MKPLIISFTFAATILCGMLYVSHAKIPVKYKQKFADKEIVLTEHMTYAQKLSLPRKSGFVQIEE